MSGFPVDFVAPALPSLNRIVAAAARVHTRWPDAAAVIERDPETIVGVLMDRLRRQDWQDATVAETLRAARVVFSPDFRNRRTLGRLRDFLARETSASTRPSLVGGMLSIYVATYDPGADHTRALARSLRQNRSRIGGRWSRLLAAIPRLLEPGAAHLTVARRMRNMEDPWSELRKSGIRSPHAPGLMDHVHLAYLNEIAPSLTGQAGIDRLCRWLKPIGREARSTGATESIEALLEPWKSRSPGEDLRNQLIDQLLALYGDPRTRRGAPWIGVRQDLKDICWAG